MLKSVPASPVSLGAFRFTRPRPVLSVVFAVIALVGLAPAVSTAAVLQGGAAKVDITNEDAGPVNDRLYVRALVLKSDTTMLAIVAVDAVAIGEIGYIKNDYLGKVRAGLKDIDLPTGNILINASHCHGIPRPDVDKLTIQAVREAASHLVPVRVGMGTGREDRVMENRRIKLKSGRVVDVRHAYALPPDDAIVEAGPVDTQIGLLRVERLDGTPLAAVYNFACHPIMSVPGGANTADMSGFASKVIEENLGDGAVALFIQGCGGDINPVQYKDVDHPRHAEPLGNMLGLSTLAGLRQVKCTPDERLTVINETIPLPRGDRTERIEALESEQRQLVQRLTGTSLSLKTYLPLAIKYNLAPEFPSASAHRYLHEQAIGRSDLLKLDAENRKNLEQYTQNILTMEQLTRVNTNLALLRRHQAEFVAAGKRTVDVELLAVRVGDFILTTFPGELTVDIGLNIKRASPQPNTFVAGYTNGYIYYAPTAEQLRNCGNAQEDSDCILAPEWQEIYESKARELLGKL